MSDPTLSFVVLSYNYARYLGDCLESILAQENVNDFEVLVVDDASTDGSQDVAQAYASRDPRVHALCSERNRGHAVTVTTGLRQARGEFIARIDCDDRYRPHFAREALRIFAEEPDVGLVYGDAALIDEAGGITEPRCDRVHDGRDFKGNELPLLLQDNFICSPTVLARRHVWLDALPLPSHLAFHDWYFTLMAARRSTFYYTSHVVADYRVHSANFHKRIIRERTEEPSIFWLLGTIFAQTESDPELESAKQRVKAQAYGRHYRLLADKYFGMGMQSDARRCYFNAVRWQPTFLLRPDVLRHLAATMTSRTTYERMKSLAPRQASD